MLKSIIAEIGRELENLEELRREMAEIQSDDSIIIRRSKGSILHDFYNCCERIFKKIAVEIDGGLDESDRWHKSLLFKMTIAIKDIRPEVISEDLAAELDEYLTFRHVFRNIYGFELKGSRIGYLSSKFEGSVNRFKDEIGRFLDYLKDQISS